MSDARLGRAVELEKVDHVVENISESSLRNSGALLGLLTIKNKDDYTFLHSVSVCALLFAFCRTMGLDDETIRQAGLGVVLQQNDANLLEPRLKIIFSTRLNSRVEHYELDLSRPIGSGDADRIVSHEDPARWQLDTAQFVSV